MEVPYGRFLGNLLFLFCLPCALAAKKKIGRFVAIEAIGSIDYYHVIFWVVDSISSIPAEAFQSSLLHALAGSLCHLFGDLLFVFQVFFLPWPHHVSFHFFPFTSKSRQDTTRSCKNPEKGMAELLVLNPHLTTTTRHVMVGITRSKVISFFALN